MGLVRVDTSWSTARSYFRPDLLAELDVVIASIHKRHRFDEAAMTRRLVTIGAADLQGFGNALGRILVARRSIPCRYVVLDVFEERAGGDRGQRRSEPTLSRLSRP